MSNNKQSMKLYTEEQLTRYLLDEGIMELSDLANNLIPHIELPSDEEIWKWWKTQKFQKEQGEQEYRMLYEIDLPKILKSFIEHLEGENK